MNRLWPVVIRPLLLVGVVWLLSVHNIVWAAVLLILAVEWPVYHRKPTIDELLAVVPETVVGLASALIIAQLPRALSQLVVAAAYLGWRAALAWPQLRQRFTWLPMVVAQVVALEALFLWAAISHPPRLIVLLLLFATSFVLVYGQLHEMKERAAAVLAATWAVIVVEAAWVFLSWLVSYVIVGGYFVVPQPTIILSGLGYCAGSIFMAGKRGELSRARLSEYLIITCILIIIVVTGTVWRASI